MCCLEDVSRVFSSSQEETFRTELGCEPKVFTLDTRVFDSLANLRLILVREGTISCISAIIMHTLCNYGFRMNSRVNVAVTDLDGSSNGTSYLTWR